MIKLRKYQREGVRRIDEAGGRALLADEMGLGKTIQASTYASRFQCVIVVCPASVKRNWEREIMYNLERSVEVLEGTKPPRHRLTTPHSFIVVSYNLLHAWKKFLISLNADCVILDEVHYIKSRETQRYKVTKEICSTVPHIVALSGTPLTNRPAELWTILNLLKPSKFKSFTEFARRYCEPVYRPWGWQYKGATNLTELHKKLKPFMIRRLKSDVLDELPSLQRVVQPIEIQDRHEYQEASTDLIRWLAKENKRKASKAKRAEKLVRFGYLLRLAAKLKFWSVVDWIDSFQENCDRKLVLFAKHKKIIRWLQDHYRSQSVAVTGELSSIKRQHAIDKFNKDKRTKLFVGQLEAAGTGINLQHGASDVAFVELSFVPALHTQAEARVHRMGQTRGSLITYLVARGTVEENLCEILQKKQDVLDQVVDGKDTEQDTSFDVYDLLENQLLE